MNRLVVGIDPGSSGGICLLAESEFVEAFKMPSEADLQDYFRNLKDRGIPVIAYLEKVGGYIQGNKTPGSAMFNFGNGYGYIRGMLTALEIPYKLVTPQKWQKGLCGLTGKTGQERKRALKDIAKRQFPSVKVTLSTADAILIADYGREQN